MTNKSAWKRSTLLLLLVAAAISSHANGQEASNVPVVEEGKFRLHKFEQAIGWGSYQITKDGNGLAVKTEFKFNDRGTDVPLTANLKAKNDWTPTQFEIKGKNS